MISSEQEISRQTKFLAFLGETLTYVQKMTCISVALFGRTLKWVKHSSLQKVSLTSIYLFLR